MLFSSGRIWIITLVLARLLDQLLLVDLCGAVILIAGLTVNLQVALDQNLRALRGRRLVQEHLQQSYLISFE